MLCYTIVETDTLVRFIGMHKTGCSGDQACLHIPSSSCAGKLFKSSSTTIIGVFTQAQGTCSPEQLLHDVLFWQSGHLQH